MYATYLYLGTGGDEAGIWAGDLVASYRKYAEDQQWKVSVVSESAADMGGFKTCVLQITGNYVYSKMKYEVRFGGDGVGIMIAASSHSLKTQLNVQHCE